MALRVGILCNGTVFQHWQAEAIRHVLQVPGVEIVLLVIDGRVSDPDRSEKRLPGELGTLLYRKYRERWFGSKAMESDDLSTELAHVARMECAPVIDRKKERFTDPDLAAIRAYRPDVLLRFGFNILAGEVLQLPTYGVWSFHHGDEQRFRGGPPGFWEIMRRSRVTGAILQRLTERLDGGRILRKGWFATIDHSLKETVDTVLLHTAIWPAQVMRELIAGKTDASTGEEAKDLGRLYRYPGNFTFIRFLFRSLRNKLRFHRRELNEHEEWNIGVLHQPITVLLEDEASLNVRWLPSPSPNNFRADPFGYTTEDGTLNVLYEKFDHSTARGEIARVRPRRDGVLKRSRTMLTGGLHYSYPYVVQRKGNVFVIPECAAAESVELYRLNESNDGLDRIATLLNEPLFDPTLFEHEGRWWLFGTKAPLTNVALFAFHSDRFEGPYTPHLLNPIKFDIRSARPGGTPFVKDGVLWRPGQDSSRTYGGRIALNRIEELTPAAFRETTVKFVEPFKGSAYDKGVHTIAAVGDITLVDGKRFVTVEQRKALVRKRKLDRLKRVTAT